MVCVQLLKNLNQKLFLSMDLCQLLFSMNLRNQGFSSFIMKTGENCSMREETMGSGYSGIYYTSHGSKKSIIIPYDTGPPHYKYL